MTAYELSDLMNGVNSNIIAAQAVFLSIVTAYLVVAYARGSELTRFQVFFVNAIFLTFMAIGIVGQMANMEIVFEYTRLRAEALGRQGIYQGAGEVTKYAFVGVRLFITVGALYFMWQVRNPKTE